MCSNGLFPSSSVEELATLLNECRLLDRNLSKALHLHTHLCQRGLEKQSLGHKLVRVLVECDGLFYACQVFQKLEHNRDGSSWNWLITGYMEKGHYIHGFSLYGEMQRNQNLKLSPYTYVAMLQACIALKDVQMGSSIHAEICRISLSESDFFIATTLVDMYSKCGVLSKAQQVLDELPTRNIVSWNALIAGYAQQGQYHEVLRCFGCIQSEGLSANMVTYICILKACACIGAVEEGKQVHDQIMSKGLLEKNMVLGTALVDMYAKCGVLAKAELVFKELPIQSILSWNALIAGYVQQGQGYEALNCFERMQSEGFHPDDVTCLCVLSACCHSGLLDDAQMLFRNMTKNYGIVPNIEHHTCMVGVLGCSDEAMVMIKSMPVSFKEYPSCWLTFLGACKKWGNLRLALLAFDEMMMLRD